MQYYKVITGPVLTPVTVAECKDELIVEHSRHDTYIGKLIDRAVDYLENYLERPIMEQTVEITTDERFDKTTVSVPSPVISVDSITAVSIDTTTYAETETVLDTNDYALWDKVEPSALFGDFSDVAYDYYKIRVTAGYASADDVPAGIKDLIYLLVSSRYSDRLNFHEVDIRPLAQNYRFAYVA